MARVRIGAIMTTETNTEVVVKDGQDELAVVATMDRRAHVEQLLIQGHSQRSIVRELTNLGSTNPKTGRPWDLKTINTDCQKIRSQWGKELDDSKENRRAEVLMKLKALEAKAWNSDDLVMVRQVLKDIRTLFALDEETKVKPGAGGGINFEKAVFISGDVRVDQMSDNELDDFLLQGKVPAK